MKVSKEKLGSIVKQTVFLLIFSLFQFCIYAQLENDSNYIELQEISQKLIAYDEWDSTMWDMNVDSLCLEFEKELLEISAYTNNLDRYLDKIKAIGQVEYAPDSMLRMIEWGYFVRGRVGRISSTLIQWKRTGSELFDKPSLVDTSCIFSGGSGTLWHQLWKVEANYYLHHSVGRTGMFTGIDMLSVFHLNRDGCIEFIHAFPDHSQNLEVHCSYEQIIHYDSLEKTLTLILGDCEEYPPGSIDIYPNFIEESEMYKYDEKYEKYINTETQSLDNYSMICQFVFKKGKFIVVELDEPIGVDESDVRKE